MEDRHQLRLPRCLGGVDRVWVSRRTARLTRPSGANVAGADVEGIVFSAIDVRPAPAQIQRTPPTSVTQPGSGWPLACAPTYAGGAIRRHQERTAWLLNDAAPPTFPTAWEGARRYTDYRTTPAA